MRIFLTIAVGSLLFFTSCASSECYNPTIRLDYVPDSSRVLVFNFNTYEKGSGFSKLINSELDSAYYDNVYKRTYPEGKHASLTDQYDYIITVPATGKTFKVSDISYSGRKKVRDLNIIGEYRTSCTRTVSYIVNGQAVTIEGETFETGYGHKGAVITITK